MEKHKKIWIQQAYCEKKLARLLFHFGLVDTTVGDCEQQVPTITLRLQHLTTSVTTVMLSWQQLWTDQVEQEAILIYEQIVHRKQEYLLREDLNAATEAVVPTSI